MSEEHRRAHKYDCGDSACLQWICIEERANRAALSATPAPVLSEDGKKAMDAVALYGQLRYPVGADRSHLCHAAVILADEVRRLMGEEKP